MSLNDLSTPHELTRATINRLIESGQIGNYDLGFLERGQFRPTYTGRSDTDLRRRLLDHFQEGDPETYFTYRYAPTRQRAYERELKRCQGLPGLRNERRPCPPATRYIVIRMTGQRSSK